MRMRFKPYARPELLACDFHVHEPLTLSLIHISEPTRH